MVEELKNYIDLQFIKNRDMPSSETISKLFYAMQGDLKVHTEILERIESQTIKTNGRCNKLENEMVEVKNWQSTMNGKLTMVGVFCTFISPFVYWFLTK
jgi:hypothetical protein